MKKLFWIILSLCPIAAAAQTDEVVELFDSCSRKDSFTSVQLESPMMRMMSRQAEEQGDTKLASMLRDIRFIRILALRDSSSALFRTTFVEKVSEIIDRNDFTLVSSVSENNATVRFYLLERQQDEDNKRSAKVTISSESRTTEIQTSVHKPSHPQSELIMLKDGVDETLLMHIYGKFDLLDIGRLSSLHP